MLDCFFIDTHSWFWKRPQTLLNKLLLASITFFSHWIFRGCEQLPSLARGCFWMHSCSESKSDSQAPFLNKRRKRGHRSPGGISVLSSSGEGQLPDALAFFLLFSWVYLVRLQETCFFVCLFVFNKGKKPLLSESSLFGFWKTCLWDTSGVCLYSECPRRAWGTDQHHAVCESKLHHLLMCRALGKSLACHSLILKVRLITSSLTGSFLSMVQIDHVYRMFSMVPREFNKW